jgi:hypothetical protein
LEAVFVISRYPTPGFTLTVNGTGFVSLDGEIVTVIKSSFKLRMREIGDPKF